MSETAAVNTDQITYWNELAGRTWAELSDLLDRQMEGVTTHLLEVLAPRAGERILDIGCGCGRTTLQIAGRVGPAGRAVGVDISRPMLEIARSRAAAANLPQAEFVEADAQTYAFGPPPFDAVFSRFGVMFFADPVAAFANLRRTLKPGGRLVFLCWRAAAENPIMTTPMLAVKEHFPPMPPPEPGAPGPFAFADQERLRGVLESAGFGNLSITPHDAEMGGNSVEESMSLSLRVGPLGGLLRQSPEKAEQVRDAVRAALAPHVRDGAVWQQSATWIVTATNP